MGKKIIKIERRAIEWRNKKKLHPELRILRKSAWANSILQHNRSRHCTKCGFLLPPRIWFKTRQYDGIVINFCTPECEIEFDHRKLDPKHE